MSAPERRARWASDDLHALRSLVQAYPVGGRTCFGAYSVVAWPRDWRIMSGRDPDGLRAGDELETVGYGATRGFPEALLVRRVRDGASHLVFTADLRRAVAPRAVRQAAAVPGTWAGRWSDDGGRDWSRTSGAGQMKDVHAGDARRCQS